MYLISFEDGGVSQYPPVHWIDMICTCGKIQDALGWVSAAATAKGHAEYHVEHGDRVIILRQQKPNLYSMLEDFKPA